MTFIEKYKVSLVFFLKKKVYFCEKEKVMINNFQQIREFLKFPNKGDFYFIQVIQRRKENHSISRIIRNFYIHSVEQFEKDFPFVKELCDAFNARAYICLNTKNDYKVATMTLVDIAEKINNGAYGAIQSSYDSACGKYKGNEYTWLVDIDTKDIAYIDNIKNLVEQCEPSNRQTIVAEIPTKNGVHLIYKPFNRVQFNNSTTEDITIHKNAPTLLYIKD